MTQSTIYILTIRDLSDFGNVMHQSAHADKAVAHAYAEHVAIPECQARVEPEWHYAIDAAVRPMTFFKE